MVLYCTHGRTLTNPIYLDYGNDIPQSPQSPRLHLCNIQIDVGPSTSKIDRLWSPSLQRVTTFIVSISCQRRTIRRKVRASLLSQQMHPLFPVRCRELPWHFSTKSHGGVFGDLSKRFGSEVALTSRSGDLSAAGTEAKRFVGEQRSLCSQTLS